MAQAKVSYYCHIPLAEKCASSQTGTFVSGYITSRFRLSTTCTQCGCIEGRKGKGKKISGKEQDRILMMLVVLHFQLEGALGFLFIFSLSRRHLSNWWLSPSLTATEMTRNYRHTNTSYATVIMVVIGKVSLFNSNNKPFKKMNEEIFQTNI